MSRKILLNPGPVTLSDDVRRAAVAADWCHREAEFLATQARVIDRLTAVYDCDPAEWTTVTLGGSGTAAMEAMVASLVGKDVSLLVIENGVYGERLSRIAELHGIPHQRLSVAWGGPVDLERLARELATGKHAWLAMVHHETTTGRLNPVREVADLCDRHGVRLMLDGVSSFAAEDLPFEHPALQACAATANKCLHGIPGLAFVTLRRSAMATTVPQRSLYLHLQSWAAQQDAGSTPFTPPVNSLLALDQALRELAAQGGWRARQARYRHCADRVRQALQQAGVEAWLPAAESSCALRSYRIPGSLRYDTIHDGFAAHGFVIYAGQGGLSGQMFRISTMGDILDQDLARLESAIEAVFHGA